MWASLLRITFEFSFEVRFDLEELFLAVSFVMLSRKLGDLWFSFVLHGSHQLSLNHSQLKSPLYSPVLKLELTALCSNKVHFFKEHQNSPFLRLPLCAGILAHCPGTGIRVVICSTWSNMRTFPLEAIVSDLLNLTLKLKLKFYPIKDLG